MRLYRIAASVMVMASLSCAKTDPPTLPRPVTAEEVLSRYVRFLHAPAAEQAQLADEVERLGADAAPYLETRLRAPTDVGGRAAALILLQRINDKRRPSDFTPAQVREYLSWLADSDVIVRTYAMESLIRAGQPFRQLIKDYQAHADASTRDKLEIVLREMQSVL